MREPGRRTAHDLVAVGVALGAHALALALLVRTAPVPPGHAPSAVDFDALPIVDLTELDEQAPPLEPPGAQTSGAPAAEVDAVRAPKRVTPVRSEIGFAPSEPAPEAGPGSAATPPSPEPATSAGAEARSIDLGIGPDAWMKWLGRPGQGAPSSPAPLTARTPLVRVPRSTTGGLVEGLEAADRQRSAGPSGRVVNALEQAAHGEGATAFGVARFAVTVLNTGGVEVRLERASATEADWRRVAVRAAAALASNAPRIPPPRKGARFVVELSAEMVMPNGARLSELHGPRFETTLPIPKSTAENQKDMTERNPTMAQGVTPTQERRANAELPGIYVAESGKVCSYRLGLSVLGPLLQGGCDPVNAGAKPQRRVLATVRDQELF